MDLHIGPCVKGTCPAPAAKHVSGVTLCRFDTVNGTCSAPAAKRVSGVTLCRFNRVKSTCPAPAAKQVSGVRLCKFSRVKGTCSPSAKPVSGSDQADSIGSNGKVLAFARQVSSNS